MNKDASEIDHTEFVYPFCLLPDGYFRYLLLRDEIERRTLLQVQTWDGREVLSVDTVDQDGSEQSEGEPQNG